MSKSAHELTRREMKGPDKFQVAATEAAEWAHQNRRTLLLAVGGAAAILVAVVAIRSTMQASHDRAGGALYQALDVADGMVSPVPLPGVERQVFKTEEERLRALVEAADRARRDFKGTPSALTAALASGDASLQLKQWDAALAAFNEWLAAGGREDSMRYAALDGIARALEGKGDLEGAAKAYERAGQEAAFYADRETLERARVLQRAGKADEARKLLEGFPEAFKDSALKGEAQERLARLGGK